MGGGVYSVTNATATRATMDYHTKSNSQIFTSRGLDSLMDPMNVTLREARDSDEHPSSLGIIIGLDVTASMGTIPQMLVRDGLPKIVGKIIENGELDPQLLFLGIGDHECDNAPLQVGQFESGDELLDKWLTTTYLEGGGGGNDGESYLLAWYFAAMHTAIDCHQKRGRKGILVTIGDEPTLQALPASSLTRIMGKGQHKDYTDAELLGMAQESYDVYHIHVLSTGAGQRYRNNGNWLELLGANYISAQTPSDVASTIISIVANHGNTVSMPVDVEPLTEDTSQAENEEVL